MLDIFISPKFLDMLFLLALIGLVVAIFSDHMQLLAKYQGSVRQRVARGYNLAMKIMVVNRLGAVTFFLLIAFNIDNGLSPTKMKMGFAFAILLIAIPTVATLCSLQRRINDSGSDFRIMNSALWPRAVAWAALGATVFNLLGLTLPWIASATYPEMRLTLANTSFLFNTIFTVINVFFIEHRFARLIDSRDVDIHGFVAGVMVARLTAFIVVSIGLGVYACLAK